MTAQQLKNSILQMAVQGKLVPQDPNDEPASVLLERIQAEKAQMVKDGKIKKEKNPSVIFRGDDNLPYEKVGDNEPACIADEVPFEIPDSWEWVRVKYFTTLHNGKAFKPSDWSNDGLPIVRIQNLNDHDASYNHYKGHIEPEYVLHGNELLFAWSGTPGTSFGAHIWYGKDAVLNQHIFRLEFDEQIVFKPFYMYALNQRVNVLISAAHGSAGLQHVTKDVFENTLIPLPPYDEQQRIVSRLEDLNPFVNKYNCQYERLESLNNNFPDQIKKSILQQAVQGKLVPQDPTDEPASVLLERIRAEKEQMIKAGKIKRDKHESVIYRKDDSFYEKVDGVEQCIDDEIPFEIPESWEWTRVKTIANKITDGTHHSPPNSSFGDYMYVTAKNVKDSGIDLSGITFVSADVHREIYSRCDPQEGDVLLIKDGATTGTVTVNNITEPFSLLSSVALLKLPQNIIPWYVVYVLRSDLFYKKIRAEMKGTGITRITLKQIEPFLIPIPPVGEQKRIVKKIENLLLSIDNLECHI